MIINFHKMRCPYPLFADHSTLCVPVFVAVTAAAVAAGASVIESIESTPNMRCHGSKSISKMYPQYRGTHTRNCISTKYWTQAQSNKKTKRKKRFNLFDAVVVTVAVAAVVVGIS